MTVPTIHLNGTGREALLEQTTDAARAVTKAIQAVMDMAPNGRDYYPQGDEALRQAQNENASRLARLVTVQDELEALSLAIADAGL